MLMYLVNDGVRKTATSRGTNGETRIPNFCACTPPSCGSITGLPRSSGMYYMPLGRVQASDSCFIWLLSTIKNTALNHFQCRTHIRLMKTVLRSFGKIELIYLLISISIDPDLTTKIHKQSRIKLLLFKI